MNRILLYSIFLCILGSCKNERIETTVTELKWPLLEEVTTIRYQLCASNEHFYLSTEKNIYQLNDTSESASARLLISFPDSLWDACMKENYPGDTCIKPADFDHDFTRNMSDFHIEEIKMIDSSKMLIFLTYKSLTRNKDRKGMNLNKDIQTKLLDLTTLHMEDIPYDGVERVTYLDTMRHAYIDQSYALFPVEKSDGLNIYTTYITTYTDSNWAINNDLIGCYHPASDRMLLFGPNEFIQNEEPTLGYLNDDNAIYRICEKGIQSEIKLDSGMLEGYTATSVLYLEKKNNFLLSAIQYNQETALYNLRGVLLNREGQAKILFQEENLNAQSTDWQQLGNQTFGLFKESNGKVELIKVHIP
ncbi:MAG: hypothetical protein LPK45_12070 [Bacteroidota bacterium]|nr:hypothetical protein [Bacteroidota bacterium]MDX5431849.1 hypothetical protein [Bacteroidota bacterium]MDX5470560.1 hypothetical protein [Bacteroidota bacterium]